ncbi:MAG: potassium transporter TrkH [Lentisphaerae bacterium]|nr:potassium transporter TrkH [Lentisphaerota bacterium]
MKNHRLKMQSHHLFIQGIILGLLPIGVLVLHAENPLLPGNWIIFAGVVALTLVFWGTLQIFRAPRLTAMLALAGISLGNFILFFEYQSDPLFTMFALLTSIALLYYFCSGKLYPPIELTGSLQLERMLGAALSVAILTLFSPLFVYESQLYTLAVFISLLMLDLLAYKYTSCIRKTKFKTIMRSFAIVMLLTFIWLYYADFIILGGLMTGLSSVAVLLYKKHADLQFLGIILQHPARGLAITFFLLCIGGTLLLRTPVAMQNELSVLEAAFTATSASCVTGLTVIDISSELTLCGRSFLLLLIQLGGLGIMTLTAMALHALGKLSLSGEQLLNKLAEPQEQDIFKTLKLIVIFTFTNELIGALLLTWGFYTVHHNLPLALELGIFTSVSAYCNAGFFPGTENLVPYAGEKFLLIITALEIILGGIAPAITYSYLKIQKYRQLPVISQLILKTTAILLLAGTFLLLLFEWNGIFKDMAWYDKLVNAFFQSATLRTAGFNTVNFALLSMPSYIVMLILMFIGGSPGGTAGGIKTTTLAVLALTFRSAIRGDDQVNISFNTVRQSTINKAVAILISAALVLILTIFMLTATQTLPAKQLVFEAVSALATVGLSLNCTTSLDAVGQIIIMLAMFIGRIGPLTLFLLLSEKQFSKRPGYPTIKIPLA